MKSEILVFSILMLLFLFFFNLIFENYPAEFVYNIYREFSYPLFYFRKTVNEFFDSKNYVYNITLFGDSLTTHDIISEDAEGFYLYKVETRGLVFTIDGSFVGFVRETGKYAYFKKWWYDSFRVTVVAEEKLEIEAFYNRGNLIIEDNIKVNNANVYLSKFLPYGRLLAANEIRIGRVVSGKFYPDIPEIGIKTKLVVVEDYLKGGNSNGGL
ncbi:hypothetical protein JYK00_05785 [Thermosipho ferrireducens]|uniref:Uncharacterized protein n=1 Tax=Thermosipho ferrireducens TaxID=2571116 RepID=A0ABX7S496_9BACT|nr:hypothetical protein [Thermosipho ferrireducens]QTA37254.1 hypothetical protein JYK00_05785 [Thermosipho ferrireducens]